MGLAVIMRHGFGANPWRTRDAMMRDLAEMVGERDAIEAFDEVTERDGDRWRYRDMSMLDFLGIMLRVRRERTKR